MALILVVGLAADLISWSVPTAAGAGRPPSKKLGRNSRSGRRDYAGAPGGGAIPGGN